MNIYITLFAAVALEVLGTMLLPVTKSFTKACFQVLLSFSHTEYQFIFWLFYPKNFH